LLITKKMSASDITSSVTLSLHSCPYTSLRFSHSSHSVLFTHSLSPQSSLHLSFCHFLLNIQQWSLIYQSSSQGCSESSLHNPQQCLVSLSKWWCNSSLQQYSFIFQSLSPFIHSDVHLVGWSYQVIFAQQLVGEICWW